MARICIVSEFNPLHNGHLYLINKARELGADSVTCIMSGNATQRGELAIIDKYSRAEAAVGCGADLVLELPYPWCSASAEYFASAAVLLVHSFGDILLFGSECGDIELLKRAALICEAESFKADYERRVSDGEATAAAYMKCLEERGISELSSNDLLGVAYIRAINRLGAKIEPVTVKRLGAAYRENTEIDGELQSASALRALLAEGNTDKISRYVPVRMTELLCENAANRRLTDMKILDTAMLTYFRLADADAFADIAEMTDGLQNRICSLAHSCLSFEEMFDKLRTKRYTDAKLRRALLFAMTGVKKEHIRTLPEYTLLLGTNDKGRGLLSENRKSKAVNVVTKPADAPKETAQYKLGARLDALYGLARSNRLQSSAFLTANAYIEKGN